jgi:uncharacterized Zn finger protein (UPF0148 family)
MSANPDQGGLMFACPHCGGPLHRVDGGVACEAGHGFNVVQIGLEQARNSARAAWEAVRALEERARWARWVNSDPDLYRFAGDPQAVADSASRDDELAGQLRRYAEALDKTLGEPVSSLTRHE